MKLLFLLLLIQLLLDLLRSMRVLKELRKVKLTEMPTRMKLTDNNGPVVSTFHFGCCRLRAGHLSESEKKVNHCPRFSLPTSTQGIADPPSPLLSLPQERKEKYQ